VLLDAVLRSLGPMAYLAKVTVDLPHYRLAAVAHLAGNRVGVHWRPLVHGLEPRRAVGMPEHFGADLPGLPPDANGHGIEQLPEVREHRLLAHAVPQ
jgi:hypothetical protein